MEKTEVIWSDLKIGDLLSLKGCNTENYIIVRLDGRCCWGLDVAMLFKAHENFIYELNIGEHKTLGWVVWR